MKAQTRDFRTWRAFKVPAVRKYWCENGESPLVLHLSAPPFDTQTSASLQAASVDRSTSGPAAVHKSPSERCALPLMSAPRDPARNPSVYSAEEERVRPCDQQWAFLCLPSSLGCSWWSGLLWVVSPRGIDRRAVLSGPADRPSAGCLAHFSSTAENRNENLAGFQRVNSLEASDISWK